MTPIEAARQAIELRKKATQGEWRSQTKNTGHIFGPECLVAEVGNYRDKEVLRFNKDRWDADRAFIAHAANTYAAVAEAYRRLDDIARYALGWHDNVQDRPNGPEQWQRELDRRMEMLRQALGPDEEEDPS